MMRRIAISAFSIFVLSVLIGCGGGNLGPGGYLGIPAFIVDPIFYAQVEVNHDYKNLNIRKIFAVVYTDASGTPNDNSLWVFFVNKDTNLDDIAKADCAPFVVLKINDITQVTAGQHYSITSDLSSSNFMVWMDINDAGDIFAGDSIELDIDSITQTEGSKVKGEFSSVLHRGTVPATADKFIFDAPINLLNATQLSF